VVQAYSGDFVLGKADPLEAAAYRRVFQRAVRWLAADALQSAQPDVALDYARRLLRDEPWDEATALLAMRACLALRDRRAARRYYQWLSVAAGAPSDELRALAASTVCSRSTGASPRSAST
jgi:hypothetical protein